LQAPLPQVKLRQLLNWQRITKQLSFRRIRGSFMSIGTAKPTDEELAAAPHYFINSHSITESFSAGDFEKQSLVLLDDLFKTRDKVILVGGSGLFIKAVCEGFDEFPDTDPEIREKLNAELTDKGILFLQEKLKSADPDY